MEVIRVIRDGGAPEIENESEIVPPSLTSTEPVEALRTQDFRMKSIIEPEGEIS